MNAEPQKEHRWLESLAGEWTFESEPCAAPQALRRYLDEVSGRQHDQGCRSPHADQAGSSPVQRDFWTAVYQAIGD